MLWGIVFTHSTKSCHVFIIGSKGFRLTLGDLVVTIDEFNVAACVLLNKLVKNTEDNAVKDTTADFIKVRLLEECFGIPLVLNGIGRKLSELLLRLAPTLKLCLLSTLELLFFFSTSCTLLLLQVKLLK